MKKRNSLPPAGRYAIQVGAPARVTEAPPAYATAPVTVVTATEAARRFSDLASRACYQRETFVIERGGRPICQLGPAEPGACSGADLLALLARLPSPDPAFLDAVDQAARNQPAVAGSPWER